jgi:O-antigen ligase
MVAAIEFGIWIVFSLYWATDNHFAVVWFFKWALSLGFAVAFAVLVQEEKHVTAVLAAFVVAAVAFGLVGLLTYVGSGGASRGSGLTGDPNQFAAYEALAVPAALVLAGTERWSGRRPPLYFGIAVIVLSIVASYSRGGFLTLGVILVGTLAVSWRVFFRSPTEKGTYIGLLVFVGWIILVVGSTAYVHRIDTIFTGSDRGSGRTDLWSAAWRGYTQHPYLGLGAGGFEAHSLDLLHTTPGVDITASYVRADRPVHNAYLESLVDLGPLGLALFLAVVGLTFSYLVRSARRFRLAGRGRLWRMTVGLTVSYVGLAGAMLFLSIGLGHMLWIFVGLALALDTMSGREPEPAPPERVPRRSALPLGGREGSVQA